MSIDKTYVLGLLADDERHRLAASDGQSLDGVCVSTSRPTADLPTLDWQLDLPCIKNVSRKKDLVDSYHEGIVRLYKRYPFLEALLENVPELKIAGSAALYAIMRKTQFEPDDVDLFYAGDHANATESVVNMINFIRNVQMPQAAIRKWAESQKQAIARAAKKRAGNRAEAAEWETQQKKRITGIFTDAIDQFTRHMPEDGSVPYEEVFPKCFRCDNLFDEKMPIFERHSRNHRDEPTWHIICEPDLTTPLNIGELLVSRTSNAVSLAAHHTSLGDDFTVQVILRVYPSVESVVLGFDVGSSAVAIDTVNQRFVVSPLGAFALQTGFNIVDVKRLSPTYALRLHKYAERQFGVIFPKLDMSKIPKDNLDYGIPQILKMPGMTLKIERISRNTVITGKICRSWSASSELEAFQASDYGPYIVGKNALSHNVRAIASGGTNYVYVAKDASIVARAPKLNSGAVEDFIERVREQIYVNGRINIKMYQRYIAEHCKFDDFAELGPLDRECKILAALNAECKRILDLWSKIAKDTESHKMKWMTKHPASQKKNYLFTGSFRPQYQTDADWYGPYLLE